MNKRIGNIEIQRQPGSDWALVKMHYNSSNCAEIQLRSIEDVRDLQYGIQEVLREMSHWQPVNGSTANEERK